ncbi:MAG: dITP/XTP pyrophosphatase [Firmicutes bacterium ADurb.BinA052]|jgi:XTP/dITP diphosphohydrolase|nr:MAG: dITP/XTP pyrophosphatase [Firmicutes bacterium ADurb.BinA052]
MCRLVVATRNRGKLAEIRELLSRLDVTVEALDDYPGAPEPRETGATFRENAVIKAVAAASFTREVAVADDSGLVVDALGGAPGVMSARYGGDGASDQNKYERLLAQMAGIPDAERSARFVCVIAVASPDGPVSSAEGVVEGMIARAPRGTGGFGYDPVFLIPELSMTFGELPSAVKNTMSHRARALAGAEPLILEALSRWNSRRRADS